MSKPLEAGSASLWEINAKLGYGTILLITGLYIWPDSLIGYGRGILAFLLIASALCLFISSVQLIVKRERFKRDQIVFEEQFNEVKTSKLGDPDFIIPKEEIRNDK